MTDKELLDLLHRTMLNLDKLHSRIISLSDYDLKDIYYFYKYSEIMNFSEFKEIVEWIKND